MMMDDGVVVEGEDDDVDVVGGKRMRTEWFMRLATRI